MNMVAEQKVRSAARTKDPARTQDSDAKPRRVADARVTHKETTSMLNEKRQ